MSEDNVPVSSLIVTLDKQEALQQAVAAMRAGEVVAFATDTVYGLGTALSSREGIARIYALKGRGSEKALPVLIGDRAQLHQVATGITVAVERLADHFWPGALTIVLPRHASVPPDVALGRGSIGIRLPDHATTIAVLMALGAPIASTSANPTGQPAAMTAQEALAYFPHGLAAILDGGQAPGGVASTVLDLTRPGRPVLLRQGAISRSALQEVLGRPIA